MKNIVTSEKALTLFLVVVLSSSCQKMKISDLRIENDSLRYEIEFRNDILIAMNEVNDIADSILNLSGEGTSDERYRKYLQRIQYLHDVLMISQEKLGHLRRALNASTEQAGAYNLMMMALQDEVSLRDEELDGRDKKLDNYKKIYEANLMVLERTLAEKDKQLVLLQNAIESIRRMNAAESYFIQAQRLEEKGRRIIFAPRKKKENFLEAMELYQKAYILGKVEAAKRVGDLRKMI